MRLSPCDTQSNASQQKEKTKANVAESSEWTRGYPDVQSALASKCLHHESVCIELLCIELFALNLLHGTIYIELLTKNYLHRSVYLEYTSMNTRIGESEMIKTLSTRRAGQESDDCEGSMCNTIAWPFGD